MAIYDGWETIRELGSGGQGVVFLARSPQSRRWRAELLGQIQIATEQLSNRQSDRAKFAAQLVEAIAVWKETDAPSFLGALKVFKIPSDTEAAEKAVERLKREVDALSKIGESGILKLLHANVGDRILITEYHPDGPLSGHLSRFEGKPLEALEGFRPLVGAVAKLHTDNLVHRDIKPDNIFVASDGRLVLGDFGIVYYEDDAKTRVTETYENVGSRDWMPGWAYGMRVDEVRPSFDVFSLGKTLWAMVSGKSKLRLWYIFEDEFNLERLFPDELDMAVLNEILGRCVVEKEKDCLPSARELLELVDARIALLRRRGQILRDGVSRPCRICGRGKYQPASKAEEKWSGNRLLFLPPKEIQGRIDPGQLLNFPKYDAIVTTRLYSCEFCGHIELFRYPDGYPPKAWS